MTGTSGFLGAAAVGFLVGLSLHPQATQAPPQTQSPAPPDLESELKALAERVAAVEAQVFDFQLFRVYDARVFANEGWQEVVPLVCPGDRIRIRAVGNWSFGSTYESVGPEGSIGGPIAFNAFGERRHGALMTTIDPAAANSPANIKTALFAGSELDMEIPSDYLGPLLFRINDSDVHNNSGWMYVAVTVNRLPKK